LTLAAALDRISHDARTQDEVDFARTWASALQ
jgi:hypothetical protein